MSSHGVTGSDGLPRIEQSLNSILGSGRILTVIVLISVICAFFLPSQLFVIFNIDQKTINELSEKNLSDKAKLSDLEAKQRDLKREVEIAATNVQAADQNLSRVAGLLPNIPKLPTLTMPVNPASIGSDDPLTLQEELEYRLSQTELYVTNLEEVINSANSMITNANESASIIVQYGESLNFARSRRFDAIKQKSDAELRDAQISIQIESLRSELERNETQVLELRQESENQYLAVRAFALGSLGAFAAAASMHLGRRAERGHMRLNHVGLSMVFSGFVSLVVFAMFTTREISVFETSAVDVGESPNHWRMVILCLMAGAFADRLFAVARERVDDLTQRQPQQR